MDEERIERMIARVETRLSNIEEVIHGGTEAVPSGIKSQVSRIRDDLNEFDTVDNRRTLMMLDQKAVRDLIQIDPAEVQRLTQTIAVLNELKPVEMHRSILRLEGNEIQDGAAKFATLEQTVNGIKKLIWLAITGVVGAIVSSVISGMSG